MKKNLIVTTIVTAMALGILTGCNAYQKVEADQVQPTMEVEEISAKTPEEIAEARRIAREYNEEVQRKAKEKAELEEQRRLAHEANEKLMAEGLARAEAEGAKSAALFTSGTISSTKTTSNPKTTTQPTKTETVVQPTNNQPTQNVAQPTQTETPQPTVVVEQPAPQPEVQQPAPQPQPESHPAAQPLSWEDLGLNPDDFVEGSPDPWKSWDEIAHGKWYTDGTFEPGSIDNANYDNIEYRDRVLSFNERHGFN